MSIPATVLKVLDDWNVDYQTTSDEDSFHLMQSDPTSAYSSQVARVVFLKDSIGQVQVVRKPLEQLLSHTGDDR